MKNQPKRILIAGAGLAGKMVVQELGNRTKRQVLVGFVDDDPRKKGLITWGLPVLGNRYDIPAIVVDYEVDEVVIAMPSAPPGEVSKIIDICQETNARVKILSGNYDLTTGKIEASPIRDLQLEDLLGRQPVTLDTGEIIKYLNNQVVLVTGAGGSVGTELSSYIANSRPSKLILVGRGENSIYDVEQKLKYTHPHVNVVSEIADIRDRGRITRLFQKNKPVVVFHAAAHKHVPYMERIPEEAVKNNIFGTKILCDVASASGCEKFILISTDKAVKPTSIMGVTKKIAEIIVLMMNSKSNTKFAAVRFGNVLGSRGSVIPLFEKQIDMGGPVTITHPQMTRYFMTLSEAAQLVVQAGAMARGGEIFVLDMGEPICIQDLALKLIKLKGMKPQKDIEIKYTGIRPGEKITESLIGDKEKVEPTEHAKIYAIYKTCENLQPVKNLLTTLEDPNFSYADKDIRKLLKNFLYK